MYNTYTKPHKLLVSSTFSPSHFVKLPLSCADLHLLLQILVATRRSRLVIRCRITPAVTPAPPSLGSQLLSHTFFHSHSENILVEIDAVEGGLHHYWTLPMLAQDQHLSFVQGYVRTHVCCHNSYITNIYIKHVSMSSVFCWECADQGATS